jgi:predicted nucleotidyltransferase
MHPSPVASIEELRARLAAHREALRRRGIARLHLYGSMARRLDRPTSDVDLYAVLEAGAPWNLLTLASVAVQLEEILGRPVDFADIDSLRPEVRQAAEHDAVEVLA